MEIILLVISLFGTYILVPPLRNTIGPSLMRLNFQNREVPVGLGIIFILIPVPLMLLFTRIQRSSTFEFLGIVTLVFFGILGLIDDVSGDRTSRGFRGHFHALRNGVLTTGALKAILGGLGAFLIGSFLAKNLVEVMLNGLLIALGANTLNLFDLRPGRAGKVFLIFSMVILITSGFSVDFLIVFASVLGYLAWDLRQQVMMGDTGSNCLGAFLGLYLVRSSLLFRLGIVFLLICLQVLCERLSLTKLIESNRVLDFLDRLGRG